MHQACPSPTSLSMLAVGAVIAMMAGCGCGEEQPASVTVYITDDQFHALLDDAGNFSNETCLSICERQGELETVDTCDMSMVSPAAGVDTGDTGVPRETIWTLECNGTNTLICL